MTIASGREALDRARKLREEAAALEAQAHREMEAAKPNGMEPEWQAALKAPEGKLVWTKIDDGKGLRNIQPMIRKGNLWFLPDESMYVYFWPTHYLPGRQP